MHSKSFRLDDTKNIEYSLIQYYTIIYIYIYSRRSPKLDSIAFGHRGTAWKDRDLLGQSATRPGLPAGCRPETLSPAIKGFRV